MARLAGWAGATTLALAAAACGGPPRPARPSAATVARVDAADAAEARRDHAQARAAYLDAIASAPDAASEAHARRAFADTLLTWGEVREAAAQLDALVRATPAEASAWHDLGIVQHSLGDDAAATTALGEAKRLAPGDPRPRIALAALLWHRGDRAAARHEYRALLRLELPDAVRGKVEWALRQLADPAAANP